jgi:RNA polymerase sigma-70 factor, ECF subfamily
VSSMALSGDVAESDEQLLQRIASCDRSAFEALYRRYQTRVYRHLLSIVRDSRTAESLTNDVLVDVWKGAGRFRGQARVSTWVFSMAHHKALNELRRRKRSPEEDEVPENFPDPGDSPDSQAVRGDLRARLRRALDALAPIHREVLDLTFYHELSYDEIAAVTGCPPNTVKTRAFNAKRRLRTLLEQMGLASESP